MINLVNNFCFVLSKEKGDKPFSEKVTKMKMFTNKKSRLLMYKENIWPQK